ncbi:MAG: hypothetical protein RLY86_612 [Pseudomonadota bacterium]|jgi:uncharacterized membrane protein
MSTQGRPLIHPPDRADARTDAAATMPPAPTAPGGAGVGPDPALFRAVLHPHRSLSPLGLKLLIGGVGVLSIGMGLMFILNGAWPVLGFLGLDVLLLWWALKASNRSGRMYETVELTPDTLTVERVEPRGQVRRWRFQPYWLQVRIDDPPRADSRLTLATHGQSLTIGSFLTVEERVEFARALRRALDDLRRGPLPDGSASAG